MSESLRQRITELVGSNDVVLFMKGTRRSPACGFSARVVETLDALVPSYATVDVLADAAVRDGVKEFSEWPTIPQLYVKGAFVGGADIVRDMAENGELQRLLGVSAAPAVAPALTATEGALGALRDAIAEAGGDVLRFSVSPGFEHDLFLGPAEGGDLEVDLGGMTLHLDPGSARRANGTKLDFVAGPAGGFKIENPNEPAKVKQLAPEELQRMLGSGAKVHLFDVRTPKEREIAVIAGSIALDEPGQDRLFALDRDATIVFQCHHGGRSQAAAEHFLREGFRNVYNLKGGIDAWAMTVDPTLARY